VGVAELYCALVYSGSCAIVVCSGFSNYSQNVQINLK
jgi:hypothetical protein